MLGAQKRRDIFDSKNYELDVDFLDAPEEQLYSEHHELCFIAGSARTSFRNQHTPRGDSPLDCTRSNQHVA